MATRMSEHHQTELGKFLKFFRSRMKAHLENIEADFEDTLGDRLSSDDVYSQKDVKEAVESLCFAVKARLPACRRSEALAARIHPLTPANVRSELQDTINMMALLLRQIFAEAEDSKLALALDMATVEDKALLERVERLSVAEWVGGGEAASIGALPKDPGADKAAKAREAALVQQVAREQQQREEDARAATAAARQQREALETAHAKELKRLQRKLEAAGDRAEELEARLEDAQQHVAQTKQFQALKTMVATKNAQLQELRRRLRRHEPDADDEDAEEAKCADDDDD